MSLPRYYHPPFSSLPLSIHPVRFFFRLLPLSLALPRRLHWTVQVKPKTVKGFRCWSRWMSECASLANDTYFVWIHTQIAIIHSRYYNYQFIVRCKRISPSARRRTQWCIASNVIEICVCRRYWAIYLTLAFAWKMCSARAIFSHSFRSFCLPPLPFSLSVSISCFGFSLELVLLSYTLPPTLQSWYVCLHSFVYPSHCVRGRAQPANSHMIHNAHTNAHTYARCWFYDSQNIWINHK